jgi:ubiquinone/menaquinone biosynthesis C-methylase UbiE
VALYDKIGRTYDATRRADPNLVEHIVKLLNLRPRGHYLDLACGTGNYTVALQNRGAQMFGVDQSATMLTQARGKSDRVTWVLANAENIPFPDRTFEGAICTLAIHHMRDFAAAFREVYRVVDSGNFVVLTSDREQTHRYWLAEYFPIGTKKSGDIMPPANDIEAALRKSGFVNIRRVAWSVCPEIQDLFLYSGKFNPEIYFDPTVRAGISTFAADMSPPDEVERGLKKLRADIDSGRWEQVKRKYEHDLGDYLFLVGEKTQAGV